MEGSRIMSTTVRTEKAAEYFQAMKPYKTHRLAFTGSSDSTAAVADIADSANQQNGQRTTLVKLFATQDCWIKIGTNPTASVVSAGSSGDSHFLPGGITEYYGIEPGEKVAAVQDSSNGTLYVTEAQT